MAARCVLRDPGRMGTAGRGVGVDRTLQASPKSAFPSCEAHEPAEGVFVLDFQLSILRLQIGANTSVLQSKISNRKLTIRNHFAIFPIAHSTSPGNN